MKWKIELNIISKKHFSDIWELVAKHTIGGVIGISLILIVLQGGLFCYLGLNQAKNIELLYEQGGNLTPFYQWIDHGLVKYSFIAAIIAVCNLSSIVCANKNARYTVNRLGIPRKSLFAVWTVHSLCMILIMWGVQVAIFLVGSQYYQYLTPENMVTIQTFYLSTFRSDFFHIVLPLEEGILWIRNILLWLCLASGTAYYVMKQFQGVQSIVYGVTIFLAFIHFLFGSGTANYYMIPFMCFVLAFLVYGGITDEGKIDE